MWTETTQRNDSWQKVTRWWNQFM